RGNGELGEQRMDAVNPRDTRVRRGRHLAFVKNAGMRHQHDVGESAADIDGDPDRLAAGGRGRNHSYFLPRPWRSKHRPRLILQSGAVENSAIDRLVNYQYGP